MKIKYCLLQGFYWMLFCVGSGFVTAYLVNVGVSAAAVGLITAAFCGLSAVIQPWLGRIADKQGRFRWSVQLKIMILGIVLCDFLLYIQQDKILSGILCGIIVLLLNSGLPLLNGAAFYYENRGIAVNFGLARGCGSLFYAVISFFLGQWLLRFGISAVSVSGMVIGLILLFMMPLFPCDREDTADAGYQDLHQQQEAALRKEEPDGRKEGFFRTYKLFTVMLAGVLILFIFHNMTCTYLLQIVDRVGGTSKEMGTTLAIAAILEIPVMFGFSYIVKRYRSSALLAVCGVFFLLKSLIYLLAGSVEMIYAAQLLQPFSYALLASAGVYYTDEAMRPEHKLRGQAYQGSAATLGCVFGNLIGGFVVDNYGVFPMLITAAVFAGMGCVIMCIVSRKTKYVLCSQ